MSLSNEQKAVAELERLRHLITEAADSGKATLSPQDVSRLVVCINHVEHRIIEERDSLPADQLDDLETILINPF